MLDASTGLGRGQIRISEEMLAAGWQVFATIEVTQPMYGYGDLDILPALSAERFLVTSSFRRLQQSKISALGLARFFAAIYVDAIDEPDWLDKQGLFELILDTYHLKPKEVLVVGDNPESEIEAGNQLGIRTVQILRAGVRRADNATFYIHFLVELKELLT